MSLAALVVACGARSELDRGGGGDAGSPFDAGRVDAASDAAPAVDAGPPYVPPPMGCREVRTALRPPAEVPLLDVLFVVDNSGSMRQEQESLAEGFDELVRALVTGDVDGDGAIDFPPVTDLHVGVVSSDMGMLRYDETGASVPAPCIGDPLRRPHGDDGMLRRPSDGGGCPGDDDIIIAYREGDAIDGFAARFGCAARVGVDGCGHEQPLEAALKALTPRASPLRFAGGTLGRGDWRHDGFVRPGAILAIVVVADEDDSSLADASFLETRTEEEAVLGDAWLHPVSRYVRGFEALQDDPSRVVFIAIAGVPIDLATAPGEPVDAEAILADPRMQDVYEPRDEVSLAPACHDPVHGRAYPARRLVQVAGAMRDRAVIASICQEDLRPAIGVIADRLGRVVERTWCVDGEEP